MKFKEEFEKKAEEAFYASFELEKEAFWGAAGKATTTFFQIGGKKTATKAAAKVVKPKGGPGRISNFVWGSAVAPTVHRGSKVAWSATKTLGKPAIRHGSKLGKAIIKAPFSSNKLKSGAFWVGGVGAGGAAASSQAWGQSKSN